MNETERIWDEFWKPIVTNEDGTLNFEQVKKELLDFKLVMDLVPAVYDSITGGRFTKLLTSPEFIISAAEEHFKYLFDVDEIQENLEIEHNKAYKSLEDEIEGWRAVNRILKAKNEECKESLKEIVEVTEGFYGTDNRIKSELKSIAGEVQVICKTATVALKSFKEE